MISRAEIKNFKTINSLKVTNISKVNLIGGKNNAGKSTLLEALFLFYDRIHPEMLLRQHAWRGVSNIHLTPDDLFFPIFNNFDTNKKIEICVNNDTSKKKDTKSTLKIEYHDSFEEQSSIDENTKITGVNGEINTFNNISMASSGLKLTVSHEDGSKKENIDFKLSLNNLNINATNVNRRNLIPCIFLTTRGITDPNENSERYSKLLINGETDQLIDFLKLIEPNLKSIHNVLLPNKTSTLYMDIGIEKKIPLSYMGDGISRLTTILLAILSVPKGIVFIDEIENGIHYSVLPKVWQVLVKAGMLNGCQIFASTHSYECLNSLLDGIDSEFQDSVRYFRLEKHSGEVIAKSFNYDDLQTSIENGWEVR